MFKYCVAGFAKKAMGMSKTQPLKSSVVLSKSSSVVSSSSSESSSCPSQQSPDASRGRSSSSCRAGNSKEELEGTAELPQGDVEDDVHFDVDVDVVGIAKLPKDNSLLAIDPKLIALL